MGVVWCNATELNVVLMSVHARGGGEGGNSVRILGWCSVIDRLFQRGLAHRDGMYSHMWLIWARLKDIYGLG